jgi:hypothetical protein
MIEREFLGKYCMIRTYSAGVFAGTLVAMEGKHAVVENARRIWSWEGAASLSQLAVEGTSNPEGCRFPTPVEKVLLTQVVEIIPMTERARKSVEEVPIWSK